MVVPKTLSLTVGVILMGFFEFTESSTSDPGEICPQYPWFDERCVNATGSRNPCKDIRECDFTDAILALGGWPTVCGWAEDESDQPIEWPKVCCGMHITLGESLKKEFVKLMAKKKSSTTPVASEEDITYATDRKGSTTPAVKEEVIANAPDRRGSTTPVVKVEAITGAPDPKANSIDQCVLPLVPRPDTSVTPEDGVRFGNTPSSRQEFFKDSEFMSSLKLDSIFSMDFKTSADSGVMFYVSGRRNDYIGLIMQDGKIIYIFNCGLGSALISSQNTYNDNKWHRVVFSRQQQSGQLLIDGEEKVVGKSPGNAIRIDNLRPPVFVGGLSDEVASRAKRNLQGVSSSFPGCIRKVEAQDELLAQDTQTTMTDATGCSSKVEEGTFFSADGGYIVLYDKYRVGQHISISMDIKPRNLSGVLMAVHGKEDYLILQLVDGRVQFTVENGDGPITATYTPGDKYHLCDGQFHAIKARSNSDNIVTLSVDSVSSEEVLNVRGVSSTDTFDPLYVGGLPESSSKSGVLTTNQFVGCLRNLILNGEPQSMAQSKIVGDVTLSTCATT